MKNESQYGLLLLQRYLYEHTDDQHPASVADILPSGGNMAFRQGARAYIPLLKSCKATAWTSYASKAPESIFRGGEAV